MTLNKSNEKINFSTQANNQKNSQQTTGSTEGLNDNIQLLTTCVIVSDKFCFSKCLCLLFSKCRLPCMDNNSLAKQARGIG